MKLKEGDVVEIAWLDSNSPPLRAWTTKEDAIELAKNEDSLLVRSSGFYVYEDEEIIILAGELAADECIGRNVTILKSLITKIRKLK